MNSYYKDFSYTWIILVVVCLVASSEALAATIYVDRDANDGSSWANAYNYLQNTLMARMGRRGLIQYPMNGTGVVTGPL